MCYFYNFSYDCLLLYFLSILLNSISTNYNLILTNITNQSVALFFIIFPYLNKGIKSNIYVTLVTLFLNIVSVILWIKGETNVAKTNNTVDANETEPKQETNVSEKIDTSKLVQNICEVPEQNIKTIIEK